MDWILEHREMQIIWEYRQMFLTGALMTLKLTTVAVLGGSVLGLFGALARIILRRVAFFCAVSHGCCAPCR